MDKKLYEKMMRAQAEKEGRELKDIELPNWDHGLPKTRRHAVHSGFAAGAATLMVPSLFSVISQKAMAAQLNGSNDIKCSTGSGSDFLPTISFDFGGGECFVNHFLIGGPGGQLDPLTEGGYATIGIPGDKLPTNPAMVDKTMGIAMHAESSLLAGMKIYMDADTCANINGRIFALRSNDDSRANTHFGNIGHYIVKLGKNLPNELTKMIGRVTDTSAGGRYGVSSEAQSSATPVAIVRPEDAMAIVSAGKIQDQILPGNGQLDKLIKGMESATKNQLERLSLGEQVDALVRCGYIKTNENLSNFQPSSVNPFAMTNGQYDDAAMAVIQGVQPPLANDAYNPIALPFLPDWNSESGSSIMTTVHSKMVLDGYAMHGTFEIQGHDNHGAQVNRQRQKAFDTGTMVGRYFRMAKEKGIPAVAFLCSDGAKGGNGSQQGNDERGGGFLRTNSDSGSRGSLVMLVYNPKGRPVVSSHQVGSFDKNAGAVDRTSSPFANNVELATVHVINEYLALQGKPPMKDTGVPVGFTKII